MLKAIALLGLLLLAYACRQNSETTVNSQRTRVKITSVSDERIVFPIHASGFLVPAKEIRLSFKTGGIINALYADEGKKVKKGELLATLDMAEIEAQVNQAVNGYDKAIRDFNRAKNLYVDSVVTLEQLQNAETALNIAKSMRDAALFNREHSRIMAPENGVILKRLAQIYEVIGPGYPVFVLGTSDTHWKIKASVADRDYVRIMPGDSASVAFDAYPGDEFKAVVSQLSEASNPMTGTYEIELELLPVKNRMASGFLGRIEITPIRPQTYLRIPIESIIEAEGQNGYVYVINDSTVARKRSIGISEIYDSWAAVDSGLSVNDIIATEGAAYLTDGEKVEIIQ